MTSGSSSTKGAVISYERFAFVVGEAFEHLLDAVRDREELPGAGLSGQVEGAARAGKRIPIS